MNANTILAGVLASQALLAGITWLAATEPSAPGHTLLDLSAEDVVAFEVDTPAASDPVRLERHGEGWTIASAGAYPADGPKVDEVLSDVLGAVVRSPVATGRDRFARLSVDDDDYDKRVRLETAGSDRVLYLGTASGDRSWARVEGDDDVYAARGFSTWSVGARPRDYYDTTYLRVDPGQLDSFEVHAPGHDLVLIRGEEGSWVRGDGSAVDQVAVGDLLKQATTVRISALPDPDAPPPAQPARVSWTVEEGDQSVPGGYLVGEDVDGKRWVLGADATHPVLVSSATLKPVLEAALDAEVSADR